MLYFLILIICISLDAFIVMMEEGATCLKVDFKTGVIHGLIYAIISSLILLMGNLIGNVFKTSFFLSINKILCCFILVAISFLIVIKINGRSPFEEKLNLDFGYKTSVKHAFLTSIDVFLVGLTVPSLDIRLFYQWGITFIVTFIMVMVALKVGYNRGAGFQRTLGYSCAAVYLLLAFGQLSTML